MQNILIVDLSSLNKFSVTSRQVIDCNHLTTEEAIIVSIHNDSQHKSEKKKLYGIVFERNEVITVTEI